MQKHVGKRNLCLCFQCLSCWRPSLCLSLAPPLDPENSPLYCKGALQQLKPEQSESHLETTQGGNATSNVVANVTSQPGVTENKENKSEVTGSVSKEDEVNKEVHKDHENEKPPIPPPPTTTTKGVTTPTTTTTTTSPTTSSTTPTTTTTQSSRRYGHNKQKDKEDETGELADKLKELGIKS